MQVVRRMLHLRAVRPIEFRRLSNFPAWKLAMLVDEGYCEPSDKGRTALAILESAVEDIYRKNNLTFV